MALRVGLNARERTRLTKRVSRDTFATVEPAIEISIRELHARTGHYVRKAADRLRVVITDRGEPIAELLPRGAASGQENPWRNRRLRPEFEEAMKRGAFRPRAADRDVTDLISDDREGR